MIWPRLFNRCRSRQAGPVIRKRCRQPGQITAPSQPKRRPKTLAQTLACTRLFREILRDKLRPNAAALQSKKPRKTRQIQRFPWLLAVVQVNPPKGTRTPVLAVRGLCPRPLDDGGGYLVGIDGRQRAVNLENTCLPMPATANIQAVSAPRDSHSGCGAR